MADLLSAEDHQAALNDLAQQLSAALSGTELVELPPTAWKPFKRPLDPGSDISMRRLSQLFTGRNATNVLKLSPETFVRLVSVLLYSPTAAPPHRLFYSFIAALKTWTNIEAILAALQSKKIRALEKAVIVNHNATLRSELAKVVLRILGSFSVGDDAKHCAAQMLAITTWKGPESDDLALSPADSLRLGQLITNPHDYVIRILVADAMRQLVSNGENLKSFWDKGTAQFVLDGFPVADEATPLWLLKVQDLLSEMDKDIGFREIHYSVFRAKTCTHWKDDETAEENEPVAEFLIAISTQINCIIPTAQQGLNLVAYPVMDKASMSVSYDGNAEGVMTTLKIEYSNDVGHRVVSGNKEVVRGLELGFDSAEQAAKAANAVLGLQQQQQQEAQTEADNKQQGGQSRSQATSRRRSIAIIDLSSSPREMLDTGRSDDSMDQSDAYPVCPSPLEQNADQSFTGMQLERMADDAEKPAVSTPAATRRSKSFHEKVRAASTRPTKDISQATADPESGGSASYGLKGLQNIDPGSSKLATKKYGSSTLGKANAVQPHQPLKRQMTTSESTKKAPKDSRKDGTAQDGQNSSKSAQESSSRSKKPQKKVVSTDSGDSRKQDQPVKSISSTVTVEDSQLKRLKRPKPQATGSKKKIDWEEDIRDVEEYDLPSDEGPQPKKPKLSGKKNSGRVTNNKESKNGSGQRFQKSLPLTKANVRAPKSGPAKKNKTASPVKPASAPRRSQRITKTHAYYESEVSDKHASSDVEASSDKENEPSDQQKKSKKPAASMADTAKARAALQPSLDDDHIQPTTSDNLGVNAENPIEFSDDSDLVLAGSPRPSTLGDRAGETADTVTAQAATDAQHEDEFAEDSHPMSKKQVEAATRLSKESFADRLLGFAKSPAVSTRTARPATPFGDKTKFVSSINASKSAKSERNSRKEASSHNQVSPTEKALDKESGSNGGGDEHAATSSRKELGEKAAAGASEALKQPRDASRRTEPGHESIGPGYAYEGDQPLDQATSRDHTSQMEMVGEEPGTRGQSKTPAPKDSATENCNVPEAAETSGTFKGTTRDLTVETGQENRTASAETDAEILDQEKRVSQVHIEIPRSPFEGGNREPARTATLSRLENVPKQVAEAGAYRTPAQGQVRKLEASTRARITGQNLPTSEEAVSKSPVIQFTKKGPANQGRGSTGLALEPGAIPGPKPRTDILKWSAGTENLALDETVSPAGARRRNHFAPHHGQQQHNAVELQEAYKEGGGTRHDSVSEASSHANSISKEAEGLIADETEPEPPDTRHQGPSELRGPSPQPDFEDGDNDVGSVSSSEQHSVKPPVHSSDADKSDSAPSDVGASEDNASDREDNTSQNLQQHTEQLDLAVGYAPSVGEHAVNAIAPPKKPPQQNAPTNKKTSRASHDPLGIGDMLHSTFPDSQQGIEVGAFRKESGKDHTQKERLAERIPSTTSINPLGAPSTNNRNQSEAPQTSAEAEPEADQGSHISRIPRDQSMMPPPSRKAPATATQTKATTWPGVQPSEEPSKQHSIGSRTSTGPGTTHSKPAAARSSRLPIAAANSPRATQRPVIAPAGTPEPFHAVLAVQAKQAKDAQHPQESPANSEVYSTDANDRTLVNEEEDDNCGDQTENTVPLYHKHFESTKAYDEYSSVAEEDDQASKVDMDGDAAWATGLRSTHTDLFGLVMQMTRDVLFHLGAEEDAIAAKQVEFKQGAEHIAEHVLKSWTQRLHHEAAGLLISLTARRTSVSKDVGQQNEGQILNEAEVLKIRKRSQKKDTGLKDQLDQLAQLL